ncbi:uncharacterized protein N0V89_001424 [Didymosphaeria variabile]|uniref:Peroxin/Ferlin domain-containing protein n=1 Tax=Didymosphaeria variabile TaxID=1932322 RepID=A0A9W9CGQ1_9PLEO|nr:uncharacterized protein N0V89_001424 [Didymosphaeria variabile]KAJ4360857.1 hypothetical protein N0V89_001424 [Didymosphaeria variabile]
MADQHIALVDTTENEQSPERAQQLDEQARQPLQTPDSHIDVLYENQRGWFVFGIPLFSSKALWNLRIDQSPWVDAKFKPSPVNITNAQVPDPSWVWEWKSWYVDMSHDVDEEGWQYSLWFRGAAWHGNHPWFHSFVRRRRWLRRRVKQKLPPKSKENRERLFGDTFSIGTTLARAVTSTTGPASLQDSGESSLDEEVKDVPTLLRKLKKAAIDREKIVFINKFIDEGGEELHYLAEQIPSIMSLLIFQNSRRQLLSTLMETIDDARAHRDTHRKSGKPEDEAEERRINNLLKAVEAADAECKKLEYWSDIKMLAEEGTAGNATDPKNGWDEKWQGVDSSGAEHPRDPPKKD